MCISLLQSRQAKAGARNGSSDGCFGVLSQGGFGFPWKVGGGAEETGGLFSCVEGRKGGAPSETQLQRTGLGPYLSRDWWQPASFCLDEHSGADAREHMS